jgi:hypothetical protein
MRHFLQLKNQPNILKKLWMIFVQILSYPHPTSQKNFMVKCDSLGHDISALLLQEGRPCAFKSSYIKGKNLLKPIYEKEM